MKIEISIPDAKALLALLETTTTFPDVVDELRACLNPVGVRPAARKETR